jgi:hypothetical protein
LFGCAVSLVNHWSEPIASGNDFFSEKNATVVAIFTNTRLQTHTLAHSTWRAAMERIDNYRAFKRSILEPDLHDFMKDIGNLRKAWHCAGSLFHLHDWVYAACKSSIDSKYKFVDDSGQTKSVACAAHFANALGQKYPHFQLIRGIANSSKHFILHPAPAGRSNPTGMPIYAIDIIQ